MFKSYNFRVRCSICLLFLQKKAAAVHPDQHKAATPAHPDAHKEAPKEAPKPKAKAATPATPDAHKKEDPAEAKVRSGLFAFNGGYSLCPTEEG